MDSGEEALRAQAGQRPRRGLQVIEWRGYKAGQSRCGPMFPMERDGPPSMLFRPRRIPGPPTAMHVNIHKPGNDDASFQPTPVSRRRTSPDMSDSPVLDGQPSMMDAIGRHDPRVGESDAHAPILPGHRSTRDVRDQSPSRGHNSAGTGPFAATNDSSRPVSSLEQEDRWRSAPWS
ncbi:hypothetical protein GCM10009555_093450 [Acrocarpospora macrocephala]|uniref:Uncharacterized protein n=1 Tax=Acrocarpospora macrocephala TaxID=150177 RepID=A0A5M3WX21_9ACTN|nr:hypothetical protein Amac_076140 [Acrocarpospora macrocephala]